MLAASVRGDIPADEIVPIALDERRLAGVAISALAGGIMNVAGIDIAKPLRLPDPARHAQRRGWRRRSVAQLPVWMKCGEMQRHVFAEVLPDPPAKAFELGR